MVIVCLPTWLFLQELLELASLILNRLLHEMRPDAADGEVSHVHLHQVQDREYRPEREGGPKKIERNRIHCRGSESISSYSLLLKLEIYSSHDFLHVNITPEQVDLCTIMHCNEITQSKNKLRPGTC